MAIDMKNVLTTLHDLPHVVEAETQEGWQVIQCNHTVQFDDAVVEGQEMVVFFGRKVGWTPAPTDTVEEVPADIPADTTTDTTSLLDKELAAKGGKNGKETAI